MDYLIRGMKGRRPFEWVYAGFFFGMTGALIYYSASSDGVDIASLIQPVFIILILVFQARG